MYQVAKIRFLVFMFFSIPLCFSKLGVCQPPSTAVDYTVRSTSYHPITSNHPNYPFRGKAQWAVLKSMINLCSNSL